MDTRDLLQELALKVAPDRRQEFLQFVETGEAPEEFLQYLDTDPASKEAVELAFNHQAQAFETFAGSLRAAATEPQGVEMPAEAVAEEMAQVFRNYIELPAAQQEAAAGSVLRALRRAASQEQLKTAINTLRAEIPKV